MLFLKRKQSCNQSYFVRHISVCSFVCFTVKSSTSNCRRESDRCNVGINLSLLRHLIISLHQYIHIVSSTIIWIKTFSDNFPWFLYRDSECYLQSFCEFYMLTLQIEIPPVTWYCLLLVSFFRYIFLILHYNSVLYMKLI